MSSSVPEHLGTNAKTGRHDGILCPRIARAIRIRALPARDHRAGLEASARSCRRIDRRAARRQPDARARGTGRLAIEGLVELKPNKGASVAYPTLEEARDVFDVRRGAGAAGGGEPRRAPDGGAGGGGTGGPCPAGGEAHGQDGPESIRLAGEFHIKLAEMTGNALLLRCVQEISRRAAR